MLEGKVGLAGRDAFGRPIASGAYLYVLEAGETRLLRKMLLLR